MSKRKEDSVEIKLNGITGSHFNDRIHVPLSPHLLEEIIDSYRLKAGASHDFSSISSHVDTVNYLEPFLEEYRKRSKEEYRTKEEENE